MRAALRRIIPIPARWFPHLRVTGTLTAYLVVFFTAHALDDQSTAAMFSVLPVVVAGASFGTRAGVLAGVVMIPLAVLMLALTGTQTHLVIWEGFALVVLVFVGYVVGQLHDLTGRLAQQVAEREVAERALRHSERRLRSILEHSYEGITLVNEQGEIVVFNPAMEQNTGFPAQQVLGRTIWDVRHAMLPSERRTPEALDRLKTRLTEVLQNGRNVWDGVESENEYRHPDGRTLILQEQIMPIRTEDGYLVAALCHDVTARRQSERLNTIQRDLGLMLSSTAGLSKALDQVLDTVCQFEAIDSGGIYLVGQGSGDLTLISHRGLSPEFVERSRYYGADTPNAVLVRKGQPLYGDYDSIRVTTDPVRLAENLHAAAIIPIQYEGQPLAVLNLASHTHDSIPPHTRTALESIATQIGGTLTRLRAETALRESEANLKMLFNTVDDLVFIFDLQGQVVTVNRVAELRLGYTADELRQMNVLDLLPPDRRDEAVALLDEILTGGPSNSPFPLRTRDGSSIPLETRFTRGIWDHQPVLFGLSRDITERQQVERHALELAIEKERLHILAEFVKDASHDFRTPLATISASLYLLEKSDDPDVRRRRAQVIGRQVERITRLIEGMLMMTQLDSEATLDLSPLHLNALVQEIGEQVESLAAARSLTVRLELGSDVPAVLARHDRLGLALFKVVENALHYSPVGGTVILRTYFRDGWSVIDVQDRGIGIPGTDLPHVFDRFYRVDRARSSDTGGAGLGLAIARKIVELHHGLIEVESTVGQGTTVRLSLPPHS